MIGATRRAGKSWPRPWLATMTVRNTRTAFKFKFDRQSEASEEAYHIKARGWCSSDARLFQRRCHRAHRVLSSTAYNFTAYIALAVIFLVATNVALRCTTSLMARSGAQELEWHLLAALSSCSVRATPLQRGDKRAGRPVLGANHSPSQEVPGRPAVGGDQLLAGPCCSSGSSSAAWRRPGQLAMKSPDSGGHSRGAGP